MSTQKAVDRPFACAKFSVFQDVLSFLVCERNFPNSCVRLVWLTMSLIRKPLQLRIIEEGEKWNGATKACITRNLNISEPSLTTILVKKHGIPLNVSSFSLKRKVAEDLKYAAMENALVKQLHQTRSPGIAMDSANLKGKTQIIALHCNIDDFKVSNGWIECFRKWNGVEYSHCCGESVCQPLHHCSVDYIAAGINTAVHKLSDEFNVDETGFLQHATRANLGI